MKKENKKIVPTNPHNSRKRRTPGPRKGSIYVPPAQQDKMKEMFLNGKFISEIAKETGRDWKTVAKIVRSADMTRCMDQCKSKALEIVPDILEMVQKEMQKAPNEDRVKAGIDFLTRARIFEESRTPAQPGPALQDVDSDEQERRGVKEIIEAFTEITMETHRIFGLEMPELEAAKERVRLRESKVLAGQNGDSCRNRLSDGNKQAANKVKVKGSLADNHMTKPTGNCRPTAFA